MRERDYVEYRAWLEKLDLRELELALDEHEDVPDGDYARAAPLHEAEARQVHHRGRRRDAQVRRREKWLRDSKRAYLLSRRAADIVRKAPHLSFTHIDDLLAYILDLNNETPDFVSDHDDCNKS